jgi:hypothetical protein
MATFILNFRKDKLIYIQSDNGFLSCVRGMGEEGCSDSNREKGRFFWIIRIMSV